MTRFHVFKDGCIVASTADRKSAIDLIHQYQATETRYMLRANFSIIKGEEEFIPYESEKKRTRRTA